MSNPIKMINLLNFFELYDFQISLSFILLNYKIENTIKLEIIKLY